MESLEVGLEGPSRPLSAALRLGVTVPLTLICACFTLASPAPALAAPSWGIEMTHANAYGAQGGVDPYTGSGTTFSRESGFNAYTIKVKNTSSGGLRAGTALKCEPGSWEEGPTFSYHWLRNGTLILGADQDEYTVTTEDEGNALQCQVTATNASGAANGLTKATVVEPPPSTEASTSTVLPTVTHESATVPVGEELTCEPGSWTGSPTFTYQWLRNGVAIPDATSSKYTITEEDTATALQCQVTATNAGGAVAADNTYFIYVGEAEPAPYPPYNIGEPTIPSSSEITGPVTVADQLPEGLVLAGSHPAVQVSGSGWTCAIANGAGEFTCRRTYPEEALAPGGEYTPIVLHVRVNAAAASEVTNVAAVSGGGAPTATASDPTTITPALPFGIQSFTTSVTESLGNPFTQAAGHPVAANATFVFNYTVSEAGDLETAGGTPKDIETELPPGFIGDPQNATQCTVAEYVSNTCPPSAVVGFVDAQINPGNEGSIEAGAPHPFANGDVTTYFVYNLVPQPGIPAQFSFEIGTRVHPGPTVALDAKLRSNGNYGVTIGDEEAAGKTGGHGLQALSLTLCSYGVTGEQGQEKASGEPSSAACAPPDAGTKPFLTNPAQCAGQAPATTLVANTYQNPVDYVSKTVSTGTHLVEGAPSATESFVTGCDLLQFNPEVEFKATPASEGGTSQADEPTGMSFGLKVPQTNEAGVDATPELKNATVTLPEGMTVDPSAADGLQACSNAQFGLGSTVEPADPASCPLASQIGTVNVTTPLLEKPLEGQVFLGEPECSPCTNADAEDGHIFRLFLQVRSVERGVLVKLVGHVSANSTTGRLRATFSEQPQLPFSELLLTFTGGARASLANPQTCGTFTTSTDLTPWSTSGLGGLSGTEAIAGTPDATPSSSFNTDWNGAGGACPASLPFSPSFSAGSQAPTAGASSPFSVTFGREDREQDISGITVSTPPGLLGKIAGIPQCPEGQANAGTCGAESLIGTTTVGAGPGSHPFYLGGRVYLTGPYKGQPFGLSIVVPAIAGPFNLGTVVVRASIAVNPTTAALTITSDPLPQYVDGVQLRLRKINVEVNRPGFMLNPTSCAQQAVGATLTAAQGASLTL